jgi:hypothetical protein
MRGERWLLRTGEFLVGRAARHLPAAARAERYQEWAAELPVILRDPEIKPTAARAARMLWFAADTLRGAALRPGAARRGGAHRGGAHRGSAAKNARWLGVGAALLTGLLVLLAILAFTVYYDIFISTSLAGYVSYCLSYSLGGLAACLLWRRPGLAGRCWFGAGVLAAIAGGGAARLAGLLGWGHPLLFTLIGGGGYAICGACISVAVVIVNRSARRDRRAGGQERSDREQLRGPARADQRDPHPSRRARDREVRIWRRR